MIDVDENDRGRPDRGIASSDDPSLERALERTLVRYDRRPDRCTIFPHECPEERLTTTWLSADASSFVDLHAMR